MSRQDQRWLCETPSVPGSKLLDAGCPRIVTAALLETKASQERFFAFCCHLDHRGMDRAALPFSAGLQIQAKQAEILLDQVDAFCDVSSSTSELGVAVAPRRFLSVQIDWIFAKGHVTLSKYEVAGELPKNWTTKSVDGVPVFQNSTQAPTRAWLVKVWTHEEPHQTSTRPQPSRTAQQLQALLNRTKDLVQFVEEDTALQATGKSRGAAEDGGK
eukprot:g10671.t1